MKKTVILVVLISAVVAIYLVVLPPRSLKCEVGIDGLTFHLSRGLLSPRYDVRIEASDDFDLPANFPSSSKVPEDSLRSIDAMLAHAVDPNIPAVGSIQFARRHCAVAHTP